jgi:hypothetical protein
MRNKEQYAYTVQLPQVPDWAARYCPDPSFLKAAEKLNPQWPGRGGGVPWVERDRSLLHLGQAGHSSPLHWLPLHSTLNTNAHFSGSDVTAYGFFTVGHSYLQYFNNKLFLGIFLGRLKKWPQLLPYCHTGTGEADQRDCRGCLGGRGPSWRRGGCGGLTHVHGEQIDDDFQNMYIPYYLRILYYKI